MNKNKIKEDADKIIEQLGGKESAKAVSRARRALQNDLKIISSEDFYKEMMTPKKNRLHEYIDELKSKDFKHHEYDTPAILLEYDLSGERYKRRKVKSTKEFLNLIEAAESKTNHIAEMREQKLKEIKRKLFTKEFFDDDITQPTSNNNNQLSPQRFEYTPLMQGPFYKQPYQYDYMLSHSKAFWFKNYSGLAKNIIGNIRNFVIGKGFSLTSDNEKAKEAWDRYSNRMNLQQTVRRWVDELSTFGEVFLRKVPTLGGLTHMSIDPSGVFEIVTDPININDVKYYHLQYQTQYQVYGDKNTPLSQYVWQQVPASEINHYKVNVTSFEKRGRSDILSALLYFKYFEDYTQFKLLRTKNEAAFLWDVTISGDESDINRYLAETSNATDMPPGSENVHNEAVKRVAIAPSFSNIGSDEVIRWIVNYCMVSVNIPVTYLGLIDTGSSGSKAGALVSTEPVIRMFDERRTFVEKMLNDCFDDLMIAEGIATKETVKDIPREFNFPEYISEDRSKKIQDLIIARDEKVISHQRMSELIAKELNITNYDFNDEQDTISEDMAHNNLMDIPEGLDQSNDLTNNDSKGQTQDIRAVDRSLIRKQHKSY